MYYIYISLCMNICNIPQYEVNLRPPHPLFWSECSISVVSAHCPEEELPIVRPVLSTDEKHGGALRKEIVVEG